MVDDKYITIKEAAAALGLQYWKVQRAVKAGQLPSYKVLNSRRLVRLSELRAVIERGVGTEEQDQ